MKKSYLKTMALVACLLLGLSATAQVQGDLTGDGYVDIADVNAVINMMLGKTAQTAAGDVTGDNNVDIADVNAVINIMLGKTSQEVQTFTVNGVSFKMVAVEGGTFSMGATEEQGSDAYGDEKPVHQVTLSSYSIGQTEVTQELWQAVMGTNPSYFQASTAADYGTNLQRPVEQVSWNDCHTFITKLNELTGKTFRLPQSGSTPLVVATRAKVTSTLAVITSVTWPGILLTFLRKRAATVVTEPRRLRPKHPTSWACTT